MRALHKIGVACGGDLPGAIKFALTNSKSSKVCQSLCLNAPDRLQEELLEAYREACPRKSLSYLPIEHAVMLQSDLCLSDNKWDLMRKWFPDLIQPSTHIVDHCARNDPVIVPIFGTNGNVVAHRVKNVIEDLIVPEIEHLLDNDFEVPDQIPFKCGGDSMGMESKNGQTMFVEQFMLTLLIDGRDCNNYMLSNPIAVALGHKEDYKTLKIMNRDIDPSLPRGDFSRVVRGRRFTFLDYRMGDRAFFSFELGHLGQGARCPCMFCLRRFGAYGLCANNPGSAAERVLRTNEHYDTMAKLAKPVSEFQEYIGTMRGPEPADYGVESITLKQKCGLFGGENLSQTQAQFHCLLQDPSLKAMLEAQPKIFRFANVSIKDGIDHILQLTCSIFNYRLTKTPVERYISDILHWILNIHLGLLKFTDEAAAQLNLNLNLQRHILVGDPDMTGYDGRQAQKLMEQFEFWTKNLSTHPDYPHIMELLGYWRKLMKTLLMVDFGDEPETVICEFEALCTKIKEFTEEHFERTNLAVKGGKYVFMCSCLPKSMLPVYKPGFTHACTPGNEKTKDKEKVLSVKLCTGRVPLRRVHGHYEHDTLDHMAQRMRDHGPPLKHSSWLIEAANKRWKEILTQQVAWSGMHKLHLDSEAHPGRQALKRFVRMVHPSRRHLSQRETRLRDYYECGACEQTKEPGHLRRNPACKQYFDNKKNR